MPTSNTFKHTEHSDRNRLVEQNLGLVHMIANRFKNRGLEADDLQQIATVGLNKAIDRFNPSFGVQLSTYAVPVIIGEIKRYLRDNTAVKISRSYKMLSNKVAEANKMLSEQLGREPCLSEIAVYLESSPEELSIALSATRQPLSLDEKQGDSELTLSDQIADSKESLQIEDRLTVCQLIESLPEREQKIIRWRYIDELKQSAIAERLGISQVQVSRLEKNILQKLRVQL